MHIAWACNQGNLPVHNSMDALAAAALSYDYDEGPKLVSYSVFSLLHDERVSIKFRIVILKTESSIWWFVICQFHVS